MRLLAIALATLAVVGTPAAAAHAETTTSVATVAVVPAAQPLAAPAAAARARAANAKARAYTVHAQRIKILNVARDQIGDRYVAGAAGPNAFDCSGLTSYVYRVATGKQLPHQSHAQWSRVKKVSRKNAQPGDLVFFFRHGAHHVGVYIGNGKMIDAPEPGARVRVSPISGSWWGRTFSGIGRVLPAA